MNISERDMLSFFVEMLGKYPVTFPEKFGDPVQDTVRYLAGEFSLDYFPPKRNLVWDYIENNGMLRDVFTRDAVLARLSLSLMPRQEANTDYLIESINWFIDFLAVLGHSRDELLELARLHFAESVTED